MKIYFHKQCKLGAHGSVKTRSALCLRTDGFSGLMKVRALSLVSLSTDAPDTVLFRIGVSFFQGILTPFVHGSVVPDLQKPFGIQNIKA